MECTDSDEDNSEGKQDEQVWSWECEVGWKAAIISTQCVYT